MIKNDSQNIDKLPPLVLDLIAWGFENHPVGWTYCYMYEIRLDDPLNHIGEGGDGLKTHGGGGSRGYAEHYGDDAWAVVHFEDESFKKLLAADPGMVGRAAEYVKEKLTDGNK